MNILDYLYFLAFLGASIFLFWLVYRVVGNFVSVKIISGYYVLQVILCIFFLLYEKNTVIQNNDFLGIKLYDHYRTILGGYLIFQGSLIFPVMIVKATIFKKRSLSLLRQIRSSESKVLEAVLAALAIIFALYPFLGFIGSLGYFIRVFFNYFLFAPFLAGLYIKKSKFLFYLWMIAMVSLFIAGTISGGRGVALYTAVFYVLGVFFSNTVSRKMLIVFGVVLLIPLGGYMSLVSQLRSFTERKMDLSIDRIREIRKAYEKTKTFQKKLDEQELQRQFILSTLGRLYSWSSATLVAIIPKYKQTKGFEGIIDVDLRYTFDIGFLSGTTKIDRVKAGYSTFALTEYGYSNLHENYSVDLGVFGEGMIRFGRLGVFFAGLIWSTLLVILELLTIILSRKFLSFKALFYAILLSVSFNTYAYPTPVLIKFLLLGFALCIILNLVGLIIYFFPRTKRI